MNTARALLTITYTYGMLLSRCHRFRCYEAGAAVAAASDGAAVAVADGAD